MQIFLTYIQIVSSKRNKIYPTYQVNKGCLGECPEFVLAPVSDFRPVKAHILHRQQRPYEMCMGKAPWAHVHTDGPPRLEQWSETCQNCP